MTNELKYTPADLEAAAEIFRLYKKSNLPCKGAELVAQIRAQAFEEGYQARYEENLGACV